MPIVTYEIALSGFEGGSIGVETGLTMEAHIAIPDEYKGAELQEIIDRMKFELPYFYYKRDLNAECKNVTVEDKAVTEFSAWGDNIGVEQVKALTRSFNWITKKMALERSKLEYLEGDARTEAHGIIDRVRTFLKQAFERITNILTKPKETLHKPNVIEIPKIEFASDKYMDVIDKEYQRIVAEREQKEAELNELRRQQETLLEIRDVYMDILERQQKIANLKAKLDNLLQRYRGEQER